MANHSTFRIVIIQLVIILFRVKKRVVGMLLLNAPV